MKKHLYSKEEKAPKDMKSNNILTAIDQATTTYYNVVKRVNMGQPKSVRLDDKLEEKVDAYLEQNPLKFSELVALAVEKYISEPQTIELKPIDDKVFSKAINRAMKKHKHAIDKLK